MGSSRWKSGKKAKSGFLNTERADVVLINFLPVVFNQYELNFSVCFQISNGRYNWNRRHTDSKAVKRICLNDISTWWKNILKSLAVRVKMLLRKIKGKLTQNELVKTNKYFCVTFFLRRVCRHPLSHQMLWNTSEEVWRSSRVTMEKGREV